MTKEYEVIKNYLSPNPYSRPQLKMYAIKGIAIHWVANPMTTAMSNRNYFNNLKNQTSRYASAHEIIGLNGEVIVCLPKNEVAYHVGAKKYKDKALKLLGSYPNKYLYGIECCHPDWGGKFNTKTYETLINRVSDLLVEFNLKPSKDTLWRHYDVTGKDCPHYYVQNPNAWDKLILDITKRYNEKVEVLFMAKLQEWQKEMGNKSINNLAKKELIDSPDKWKETLADTVPQWLFWSMLDRISKGVK